MVDDLGAWQDGSWKDRVDAVTAHEYTEVLAPSGGDFHPHAVANAESTTLAITDRARQILREYRDAAGF